MVGRRGNGEGSITQREDGNWRGQLWLYGRRHSVSGKTRREVQNKLRDLRNDADKGIVVAKTTMTLGDYLADWVAGDVRRTRKPTTARNYSDMVRLYITPTLGKTPLARLQPEHVERLHTAMLDDDLSPKTIRIAHNVLNAALRKAVGRGTIARNVCADVRPPRLIHTEIEWFDAEQARHLRTVSADNRWGPLIAVALASGMRQGELLGLQWGDVDLESGVLHVSRQLRRDGQLVELKSDKHRRGIDIAGTTIAALRRLKREQNEERLLVGQAWEQRNLVFCTHVGRPLNWRNVTRAYKRMLVTAGLPDRRFHALRHTNATLLLLQGVHPKIVQERLGHSSISITLDIYSHVLPRLGSEAAGRLDLLFA